MSRTIFITLLVLMFSTHSVLAKDLPITIKKGMSYIKARNILLKNGWQTVTAHTMPNGTPVCFKVADMDVTDEGYKNAANSASCKFEEIDSCSGTGMGFCNMSFFDGDETYLSITTADGEPPNAYIYFWKKYKENNSVSRKPSKTGNLLATESAKSASSINKIEAIKLLSKKIDSDTNFRDNPAQKNLAICVFDLALNEVFSSVTEMDSATLESRLKAAIDRMKASEDQKMLKCISSYTALEQGL